MRFYFFLLAAALSASLSAQTVYVNGGNTTPGDGSSWATAYANLNDALLAAPAGAEVWIAAGTYVTPDTASFFIDKELTVRGGFAGTETSADAADPDTNPTILSGDVLGNDGDMGFDSLLYDDNNRVLFITDTADASAYTVTLDGLSIVHGALAAEAGVFNADAGGGLRSYAKLNASRLKFSSNFARAGAALFVRFPSSNGSVFDDIEVSDNFAAGQRTVYIRDNIGVEFKNSSFMGEGTDAAANSGMFRGFNTIGLTFRDCEFADIWSGNSGGGIAMSRSDSTVIENCVFTNVRTDGWGGGVNCFNTSVSITDTEFRENFAVRNGAGLYVQTGDDASIVINLDNCLFDECEGGAFGGATALLAFDDSVFEANFNNCTFTDNIANSSGRGAASYIQGANNPVTVTNSLFQGNLSQGGTFVNNSDGAVTIRNSRFLENGNTTDAGRGALVAYMTTGQPLTIDSCLFENNQVTSVGGYFSAGAATYLFGSDQGQGKLTVTNTQFINNAASGEAAGGGLYTAFGWDVLVDNCEFNGNTSGSIGGALHSRAFESRRDTSDMGDVTVVFQDFSGRVSNSSFVNNFANGQGGAIGTFSTIYDLTNNVFVGNTIGAEGNSGGAVIFNGVTPGFDDLDVLQQVADLELSSTMINNTFVNNLKGEGDIAAGNDVALYQRGDESGLSNPSMSLTLLNNAFLQAEQGISVEIEDEGELPTPLVAVGNITITSLGGNFYNNEVDADLGLVGDDDIVDLTIMGEDGISALFVDIFDDAGEGVNAQLRIPDNPEDNPLINSAVVSDLVPDTDIVGNPRGDAPDIGAYEADQGAVSVGEPLANSGLDIAFFPNPTQDVLNVRNDETSIERFTLLVSDQNGRVLKARQMAGASNELDFTNVPAGVYTLQVVVNGKIYSQQVVKQ